MLSGIVKASRRIPQVRNGLRSCSTEPFYGFPSETRGWDGPMYKMNPQNVTAFKDHADKQKAILNALVQKYPELAQIRDKEFAILDQVLADSSAPIRVAVTGAAGQIGYALVYRIASGFVFGPRTPVRLQLLELPAAQGSLKGVEMELRDCAFPTLADVVITSDPNVAFEGVDYALLVGGQPRTQGMERADLLLKNADIFSTQGKALNKTAKGKDTKVLVVGNPANTNAMIASRNAPNIPAENFSAMTRLDHNRGLAQIAEKANCDVTDIKHFAIWGNHSPTQFPNLGHATIQGKPALEVINDNEWYKNTFIPVVQQRGAAVIKARGASSAASAASSLIDGVRDWHFGTLPDWTSAAVHSNGEYGIEKGLFFSYPIQFSNKKWNVVQDLPLDEFSASMIEKTHQELKQERDAVSKYLPK